MKSLKFFSIFFLLLVTGYWLLVTPAFAQAPPAVPTASWVDDLTPQKLEEEIKSGALSKETSTTHTLNVLTTAGVRMIVGPVQEEAETEGLPYRPGGAIGGVTNLIAAMYANPPASGVDYLADLGRNLGIVSPAYAQQGVGFGGLSPILPIWKAFRNIAYLFFIIIFIATGFAIMFRMKISPQAVMTIQSAIPRVVIALILVTFSYAIAGFIIDLMYVMIAIVSIAFGATGFLDAAKAQDVFFDATPLTLIGEFLTRGFAMAERVGEILNPAVYLPDAVGRVIEWLSKIPGLGILEIPSQLVTLVLAIVLFFAFFKLFFALLFAYVRILISIIFGPLQIMLGALPGQAALGSWLRGVLSNILVFPVVIAMFLLADVILAATEKTGKLWAPPFLSAGGLSAQGQLIGGLIGYGILLMTPKVVEMVNQALQIKPSPYGAAIGEAMGPITGPARYGWGIAKDLGATYIKQRVFPPPPAAPAAPVAPGAPPPGPPAPGKCFAPEAVFVLENGKSKEASKLNPGDQIKTSKGFSLVEKIIRYLYSGKIMKIKVDGKLGRPLVLTARHEIFLKNKDSFIASQGLNFGDEILTINGPGKIEKVESNQVKDKPMVSVIARDSGDYYCNGVLVRNH